MSKAEPDLQDPHTQLLGLLDAFQRFGATKSGGVTRLAASKEEALARDHLCEWLKLNGLDILVDPIGNIFGILDFGPREIERAFYCGSHLDSQPEGGNFDGVLGVASACVAALSLKQKILRGQLEPTYRYFVVACWTAEEGARFQPSLLGSSVFSGHLSLDEAWDLRDRDGVRLKDALSEIGYLGTDTSPAPDHYLELHIEQGCRLENARHAIGLVNACWGAEKIRIIVKGKADHTGPTPMEERHDALLAASHLVTKVNEISASSDAELYGSVGRLEVHPNSPNTVADRAEMWIEFRSAAKEALEFALERLDTDMRAIGERCRCNLERSSRETRNVVQFDQPSLALSAQALEAADMAFQRLDTIAGHDAIRIQTICPSTLLFAPSKDGITHSPLEFTSDKDICAALDGMLVVLERLIVCAVSVPLI